MEAFQTVDAAIGPYCTPLAVLALAKLFLFATFPEGIMKTLAFCLSAILLGVGLARAELPQGSRQQAPRPPQAPPVQLASASAKAADADSQFPCYAVVTGVKNAAYPTVILFKDRDASERFLREQPPQMGALEFVLTGYADARGGKAKAGCDCQATGLCTCGDNCPCAEAAYSSARRKAIQHGKPLVVWVATTPCRECIPDAEHCVVHSFPGVAGKGIVVGVPDGAGSLDRVASLPHTSAMQSVAAAAKGSVAANCASCGTGGGDCSTGSCGNGGGGSCASGSCGGGSSRGFFRRR